MASLPLNGYPNAGDTFTLSFQPTGLGNPLDSTQNWYTAGASYSVAFTTSNVTFDAGILGNNQVDVTITMVDGTRSLSYTDIAAVFIAALGTFAYGYSLIGAESGTSGIPSGSITSVVSSITSSIGSTAGKWLIIGGISLLALLIGTEIFKKEVGV